MKYDKNGIKNVYSNNIDYKFYIFSQNNSGGRWHDNDAVTNHVIIEAPSSQNADERAKLLGIYFDGDGDCNCCGNRWTESHESNGTRNISIYDQLLDTSTFHTEKLPKDNVVIYDRFGAQTFTQYEYRFKTV